MTGANPIFALKIIWGITLVFISFLILVMSYPLIKGRVKMNRAYGVRFPQSYYSEESWYKINMHGGKVLAVWCILLAIAGVLFVFIPPYSFGELSGYSCCCSPRSHTDHYHVCIGQALQAITRVTWLIISEKWNL